MKKRRRSNIALPRVVESTSVKGEDALLCREEKALFRDISHMDEVVRSQREYLDVMLLKSFVDQLEVK